MTGGWGWGGVLVFLGPWSHRDGPEPLAYLELLEGFLGLLWLLVFHKPKSH